MRSNAAEVIVFFLIAMLLALTGCGGGDTFATNSVPVADAGAVQKVAVGTLVTLDGSGSRDTDNNLLTYYWSLSSRPVGSSAVLSALTVARPTFRADRAGVYLFRLVVNDGQADSAVSTVTVTAAVGNAAPVADAGVAQSVAVGTPVTLDGSASRDADYDQIFYRWVITSKPAGSAATLTDPTAMKPGFMADAAGTYLLQLVVNDGHVDSSSADVTITANIPGTVVAVETGLGTFKIALYESDAPVTTRNFMDYVNSGFYSNTIFHRVIADFMIQGGGFTTALVQKSTNAAIINEASNGRKNLRGTVAMARTSAINSATSQFFINVKDNDFLNHSSTSAQGYGYAVFGYVVEGMDVVDSIASVKTGTSSGMSDVPVEAVIIKSVSVVP